MKNTHSSFGRLALTGIAAALVSMTITPSVFATPVEVDQSQANGTYTIPTANDLLLSGTLTSSSGDASAGGGFFGGTTANMTDGSFSSGGAAGNPGSGAITSLTYNLGSNTTGYNVSSFDTYTAWGDDGRYQQSYTVMYSTAAAPTTFLTLYTVNAYPSSIFGANQAHVDVTDTTGILAANVADIQFDFNTTANGWSGYQELVVTGVASPALIVPEPSTYAMMFLGLAGLLAFQHIRRRQLL
jgi:hypothetical protein